VATLGEPDAVAIRTFGDGPVRVRRCRFRAAGPRRLRLSLGQAWSARHERALRDIGRLAGELVT